MEKMNLKPVLWKNENYWLIWSRTTKERNTYMSSEMRMETEPHTKENENNYQKIWYVIL